jgi:hypothetical protein
MCMCMCMCMCVYIYVCMCIYICVYVYAYLNRRDRQTLSTPSLLVYHQGRASSLSRSCARSLLFSPPPPLEHHADLSVIRLSHSLSLARGGGGLTLLPHVEQRRALVHFKTLCLSLCLSVSRASVCRCAPSRWERERAGLQSIYSPSHTLRREEDSSTSDFSLSARIRFTWRQCENTTSHVMLCNVCYVWRPCENIT